MLGGAFGYRLPPAGWGPEGWTPAALIAVSVFATGNHLTLDSRAAGLAVALILVAIRAPFLVVVVAACATAAGVHAL